MARVIVLGATSAIAQALCSELATRGYDLVLGGRDVEELEALGSDLHLRHGVETETLRFEATAYQEHRRELSACLERHGDEIAGAVLAFGYLGDQEAARHDPDQAQQVLEVNLNASVSALTLLADHLEARGQGFLCAISSVAGDRGRQSNYVYGAAKGGLSIYLQGLRNRLHRAGVQVTTVKPGFVDTPMTYGKEGMFLVATPERVARSMMRAIERGKAEAYIPWFWRPALWLIRAIPEWLFKRLSL